MQKLHDKIEDAAQDAVLLRREFHERPELGLKEYETQSRVERALNEWGIPSKRIWETSLTADLAPGKSRMENGPLIALRADMDALPIAEMSSCGFASKRHGIMHACGHDVHMAVLLGTAKVLHRMQDEIGGIRLLFQPAEETSGGAEKMIAHGCLSQGPKADYVFGLHVKPDLPAGTIGLKCGDVHASSDMFRLTVSGKSCHGAYPHEGIDAILCAAQIIANAQSIISRNIDPLDSAVITFGSIRGGAAHNIVASSVISEGTIRTLKPKTRQMVRNRLMESAVNCAASMGAEAEISFEEGYPALINDKKEVDAVSMALQRFCERSGKAGGPRSVILERPTMGVEDFAFYLKETKGAFLFLGSGFDGQTNPGLHSPQLNINEKCIKTGIQTLTAIALHYNDIL